MEVEQVQEIIDWIDENIYNDNLDEDMDLLTIGDYLHSNIYYIYKGLCKLKEDLEKEN